MTQGQKIGQFARRTLSTIFFIAAFLCLVAVCVPDPARQPLFTGDLIEGVAVAFLVAWLFLSLVDKVAGLVGRSEPHATGTALIAFVGMVIFNLRSPFPLFTSNALREIVPLVVLTVGLPIYDLVNFFVEMAKPKKVGG